ncbi:MAG: hypothetical protein Q7R70_00140 [Candidatus Diapherotrites archaeon]|nr:hypothetical protein [Candidatus Diapherotrites archaeon]
MKYIAILGVSLLFVFFLMGCSTNETPLKEFKPAGAGFSVLMPGTPQLQTQTMNTAIGPVDIKMYVLEKDNLGYTVGYTSYPEAAVSEKTPDQMLDGARDGAVANVFGTLTSEEILSINGNPAREFTITVKGGGIRARIILVKNKLYMVLVAASKDNIMKKQVGDFLESFKLVE